jgi:hypothetical protein
MAKTEPLSGKLVAHAIATWVTFFALYLLFTGTGQPVELAAGAVGAGLVAIFDAALRARSERPLGIGLAMLYPLVPASGQLVVDTFRVGGGLLAAFGRPPSGRFCTVAAPAGTDAGRPAGRGLAVIAASLAPNSFVVGDGPENGSLLVHRLVG